MTCMLQAMATSLTLIVRLDRHGPQELIIQFDNYSFITCCMINKATAIQHTGLVWQQRADLFSTASKKQFHYEILHRSAVGTTGVPEKHSSVLIFSLWIWVSSAMPENNFPFFLTSSFITLNLDVKGQDQPNPFRIPLREDDITLNTENIKTKH